MTNKIPYRLEIDGLRAISVIAVIIYHLDKKWLPGGFLGVDIFFVISGFLITSIIYPQIVADSFSIFSFWKRRLKRLYPALLALVAATLLVSHFLVFQPERAQVPIQAISSIFSFANILFWKTTGGYWDTSSEHIPLLHTWSLSLEEQFYLCFPLFLILINKFFKGRELFLLITLFIISLSLCILLTPSHRSATFYMLPTRLWELVGGAILAVAASKKILPPAPKSPEVVLLPSVILIIVSFFLIENTQYFPGILPIFPCLGALGILLYGNQTGIVKTALSVWPMVYIGRISYSLYLWHWPVILFLKYRGESYSPMTAILATFILACLSYHCIENYFRYKTRSSLFAIASLPLTVCVCMLPVWLIPISPLKPDLGNIEDDATTTRGYQYEATQAIQDGKPGIFSTPFGSENTLCVLGSSHARMLCSPVHDYARAKELTFLSMATSGIGISALTPLQEFPDAPAINYARLKHLKQLRPTVTIIGGKWDSELAHDSALEAFSQSIQSISLNSASVIVLGQVSSVIIPEVFDDSLFKYAYSQSFTRGGRTGI